MKSIESLKEKYRVTNKQLLEALRNACSYYLCEDEVEPFILKKCSNNGHKHKFGGSL